MSAPVDTIAGATPTPDAPPPVESVTSATARAALVILLFAAGLGMALMVLDAIKQRSRLPQLQTAIVTAATAMGLPVPVSMQASDLPAAAAGGGGTTMSASGLVGQMTQLQTIAAQTQALVTTTNDMQTTAMNAANLLPPKGASPVPSRIDIGNGWDLVGAAGIAIFQQDGVPHTAFSMFGPEVNVTNPGNGLVSAYMMQLTRSNGDTSGAYPCIFAAGNGSSGLGLGMNAGLPAPTSITQHDAWVVYTQDGYDNGQYVHADLPATS